MNRRKKQKIKINDVSSLESLLQETYIDACSQIISAQQVIDYLTLSSKDTELSIDSITKIAKEKTAALKSKENGTRIKLEIGKLLNEIIKNNGNVDEAIKTVSSDGATTTKGFEEIRQMIKANANKKIE